MNRCRHIISTRFWSSTTAATAKCRIRTQGVPTAGRQAAGRPLARGSPTGVVDLSLAMDGPPHEPNSLASAKPPACHFDENPSVRSGYRRHVDERGNCGVDRRGCRCARWCRVYARRRSHWRQACSADRRESTDPRRFCASMLILAKNRTRSATDAVIGAPRTGCGQVRATRPAISRVRRPNRRSGLLGLLVMGRVGDLRGSFLRVADLAFCCWLAMECDGLDRVSCGLRADCCCGALPPEQQWP